MRSAAARSRARRRSTRRRSRPRASPTRVIAKVDEAVKTAFDIKFVFNRWTLGDEPRWRRFAVPEEKLSDPAFDLLAQLGFSKKEIEAANTYVCGTMTLEGAPRLKEEHLAVFDCANPCGKIGKRLPVGREPHPHDGGGAALHLRRHLQDHQHAQRRHRRGLQERLHAVLEAGAEGQRALPRRLQAVAAAECPAPRR